jgi:DNA-directed RNA polymerase subunit alpha
MVITDMVTPRIETVVNDTNYGKFNIYPFENRMAKVVGNAMRRVLLSSLPGSAVYSIKIDGVLHEFSTIYGVKEDVTEIASNFKKLRFKAFSERNKLLSISCKGLGVVTGADIHTDSEIEILNPALQLATMTEKDAVLNMEIGITTGTRYLCAEKFIDLDGQLNVIPIDSYFSPVEKVCYEIKKEDEDAEKLEIELWTDGSIMPNEALSRGAKILSDYINHFIGLKAGVQKTKKSDTIEDKVKKPPLEMRIEDINLSVRALNCLKRAAVETLGELVGQKESELMGIRNFGRKSMNEVIDKLKEFGLALKPEEEQN